MRAAGNPTWCGRGAGRRCLAWLAGWLWLVCVALSPAGEPAPAAKRFLITEHGAVSDGRTLNTKAIQAAIDQCAAAGGGRVIIPSGTFVSGSIFLKQGVNLHLEAGAVLKGSVDTNQYPWIDTRIAGLEMKWPAALVNADGVTGLELTGQGTLDGSGERWWREYWEVRRREPGDIDPHFKVARPRLVHIIRSRNVVVRDLLFKDPAFWNLQLTYCEGVEIRNVKVRAHGETVRAASSDGIDIDSTRNVRITGCDIECDDDAICLKSGRDADGLRVNRPTEDVVIRDCRVGPAAGLVVFGSETSGGIRNVKVYDCRADNGCGEVVRFKTRMGRGGVVEDILYENIVADGVRSVFSFNMDAFGTTWVPEEFRTPVPPERGTPVFRNVRVRNLVATNCASAGRIVGLAESPLRELTLENIDIRSETGFTIRYARGLKFENVKVNGSAISVPAEAAAPTAGRTLFLIGDSTVRNNTRGQLGWGTPLAALFDANAITVVNRALGGRSSRTFLTEGLWDNVAADLKPGDYVLMQFGHNDGGPLDEGRARASLKGAGEDSVVVTNKTSAKVETVHTYGWYLRRYITDAKAKGATPIVLSLVPRKIWKDGRVVRAANDYGRWAAEVARAEGVPFVDLNEIVARHYEEMGVEKVEGLFADEHTHTNPEGAELNSRCVVEGLRGLKDCALAKYLSPTAAQ